MDQDDNTSDHDKHDDCDNSVIDDKHHDDEWEERTLMAWVALASLIIITLLLFYTVDPEKIKVIAEFITWFYMGMTSIVGAFMGLRTWSSIWRRP